MGCDCSSLNLKESDKGLLATRESLKTGESMDVFLVYEIVFLSSDFTNTYFSFLDHSL